MTLCGHPVDEDDDTGFCVREVGHPYSDQDGIGCSLDPVQPVIPAKNEATR